VELYLHFPICVVHRDNNNMKAVVIITLGKRWYGKTFHSHLAG